MRTLMRVGFVGFVAALALMAGCREAEKGNHSAKSIDTTKKQKGLACKKKQAANEPALVELPAASTPTFIPRDGHSTQMK